MVTWVQCVVKCCEKFLKHSQRVGLRFAELNAGAEEQMQEMPRQQQGGVGK